MPKVKNVIASSIALTLITIILSGCAGQPAKGSSSSSANINSSANTTSLSPSSPAASSFSEGQTSSDHASESLNMSSVVENNFTSSTAQISYRRYSNPRFGFLVDYPSDLLAEQEPDNGDGQIFVSKDGSVKFTASGNNSAGLTGTPYTPAEYLKQIVLPQLKNVSYQAQKANWIIVSWTNKNTIGYRKIIVGSKSVNEFTLEYPVSRKTEFDPIIQHISDSFKTPGINSFH